MPRLLGRVEEAGDVLSLIDAFYNGPSNEGVSRYERQTCADLSAPKPDAPAVHFIRGYRNGRIVTGCGVELEPGPQRVHDTARPYVPGDITCPQCLGAR